MLGSRKSHSARLSSLGAVFLVPASALLVCTLLILAITMCVNLWFAYSTWRSSALVSLADVARATAEVASRELAIGDPSSLEAALAEVESREKLAFVEIDRRETPCPEQSPLGMFSSRSDVCVVVEIPLLREPSWLRLGRTAHREGRDWFGVFVAPAMVLALSWVVLIAYFARLVRKEILRPIDGILRAFSKGSRGLLPPPRSRELARLAEQAETLFRELEESMEAQHLLERGRVRADTVVKTLRGLSHDIRQPLECFGALLETLAASEDPPTRDELREYATRVRAQLTMVDTSLRQIYNQSWAGIVSRNRVDLGIFLMEVWNGVFSAPEHERIQREFDIAERPEIDCDPDLMRRVVGNLFRNAYEAVDGPFQLRVTSGRRGHLQTLEVWNSGSRLDHEVNELIFTEGYSTKSSVGRGTGLALSRTFVEAQGGTLTCQNVGNGVAFLIEIPIVDAQGALGTIEEPARDERGNFAQEVAGVLVGSGPTLAAPPRVAARTVRVHVVDDNPLVRLMWTRSLGEYCVVYKSPECFLDAVDRDEVDKSDVVVADLDFGTSSKLSGLTILERLMATMPTVRRLLSTSLPAGVQESHQAVELVLPKTAFGVVVVRNNFLSNASLSSCEKPT